MENWPVALFVFGVVAVGMIGQGWMSMIELRRRGQVLDAIKAAYAAGKEPPAELYAQIRNDTRSSRWTEVIVFTVLAVGFWIAFGVIESDRRIAFLVVAVTMTVTALGCLILALKRPGRASVPSDDAGQ